MPGVGLAACLPAASLMGRWPLPPRVPPFLRQALPEAGGGGGYLQATVANDAARIIIIILSPANAWYARHAADDDDDAATGPVHCLTPMTGIACRVALLGLFTAHPRMCGQVYMYVHRLAALPFFPCVLLHAPKRAGLARWALFLFLGFSSDDDSRALCPFIIATSPTTTRRDTPR